MKNGQVEAQDLTTQELIDALSARNFMVLTAPLHAEITRASREAAQAQCAVETDAKLATARAEAALAEREACAEMVKRESERRHWMAQGSTTPSFYTAQSAALERTADALRARTTPATLSTDTLAAIAEARGLRVVEPELLAGLEPPVLRWRDDELCWGAIVGPWRVEATEGSWRVLCEHKIEGIYEGRSTIDFGRKSDLRDNRLAAEAALRSLGVAFRVEEGGAL